MKKYILLFIAALCLLSSCQEELVGVSSVAVDKEHQDLSIGATFVLRAIISPSNADNQKVIWTVENSSVIEYVDNQDGSATIKGLQVGTSKVTARTDDGGFMSSCNVTVGVGVEKIEFDKSELFLKKGESASLNATIFPENASDKSLKWGTSDSSVATVDANGGVEAVGNGEATIFVSSSDGGFTAYCNVTVTTSVTGLSLDPAEFTLETIGSSFTIKPVISPEDATDVSVVWKSEDPKIVSVTSDGTVTAIGPGTATVTATTNDGSFTSICTVNVKSPAQHISLDKTSLKLLEGESGKLTATVYPLNSTQKTLTWVSDHPDVASVDGDGNVTARKAGTATVTVKVAENVTAVCKVTVISRVTGISLSETTVELKPGETHQLTATILPQNASNAEVTWYSDKESVAIVSQSGLVAAVGPGEAMVHVVTSDGGKMATCLVKVGTPVKGITLSISSETLYVGDPSLDISATLTPADATEKSLDWSSSDPTVASVIPGAALRAVIKPLKPGVATITATTKDGGFTATCKVTVKRHVSGVSLNKTSLNMYVGETESLTANVAPADASDKNVSWSSGNSAVASVSNDGKVTANKPGTAVIKVVTNDLSKEATCTVTVKRHVESVELSQKEMRLYLGENRSLTATVLPSDASDKNVTWSSSDPNVATVSTTGNVVSKSVGTTVITVKTADGGYQAECKVTVLEPVVYATSLILAPQTLSINIDESSSLTLQMLPANANEALVWKSDNESVAKVVNGDVTAVGAGVAKIKVKGKNVTSNEVTVTVIDKFAVTGVDLNKSSMSLEVGKSETLVATVLPEDARDKTVTWSSDKESVATVKDGVVTAVSPGTAIITVAAGAGAFKKTCVVTVVEREILITEISYPEDNQTIELKMGESHTIRVKVAPDDANEQLKVSPAINCPVTVKYAKEKGTPYWTVTVTAIYKEGKGALAIDSKNYSTQCFVNVTKVPVTDITLDMSETSMRVGQTLTLTSKVSPSDASIKDVIWESSDKTVAYVSQSGIVTAKSGGKVTITAKSKDNSSVVAKCVILVRSDTVGAGGSEGVGFIEW